ncbi:nuclear pore complex protein Nup58 [Spodoptera frugiperda]|uniref:Nuclear pore complex protein Nup58 n=1 Tax=Spodoptera frugiperda TaxID=7108 RepID=A0A9R0D7M8_SPOFR|nr:nuclear pore complex protein Nup58 [Spodoptera frugiperda]
MSFSFGTPSSAPATTGLTGGFNFGANKPATPGFGLTATSQSSGLFGNTSSTETPAFGSAAPAFGATSTAPAFGATTTPAFGATTTPAFGSTAPPAFGSTTTPAFGAAAPAFGSTTPAFGATSAAPAFGTTTPAFGATSAAPAFGATTTSAFGASAAPTFGTTTPAFGSTGLGTGGLNFGAGSNTATTSSGLSFGTPATSASTGLGGLGSFGFGSTTSTQSVGFGFGSTSTATTTTSLLGSKLGTTSVTGTQPSISATPSFGLGGVATSSSGIGAANTTTDSKSEPPKQNKLPNEISTTVESFKEFVKKQKSLSSEVMRVSVKPLHKVSREAESLVRSALSLSGEVSRARAQSRRLRSAAAAALAAAETAARDYTVPGSELEGTAPPAYVKDLIAELEQQLITFRRQMDVADKQMQSSPKLLTEQELTMGIRRMHESLVALAGRLQAVHTQVEAQKEQYLNLRKYILKDPTNVFDEPSPSTSLDQILRDAETNRKKMKSGALPDVTQGSAVLSDPRVALGNLQHLAGPTPFSYVGSAMSPFPSVDASGPSWQPQSQPTLNTSLNTSFGVPQADTSTGFQLQKPPGKRGKQ